MLKKHLDLILEQLSNEKNLLSYLSFFIFKAYNSFAENKIVYLDVNLLLNESIVGQNLNKKLKEINNKNITEFKTIEKILKKKMKIY